MGISVFGCGGTGNSSKMPTKIDVDPLLVALFDLPAGLQLSSDKKSDGREVSSASSTPSSVGRGSRLHRHSVGMMETDVPHSDTSILLGESISLTDEEYSDALAVAPSDFSPSRGRPSNSPFTTFRPRKVSLPVKLPSRTKQRPDEYITRGGTMIQTHHDVMETRPSSNKQNSPKRKKKRRSAAIKSLKKLVGRKSKSSSFDEAESRISSPTLTDPSYVGDNEQSPNTPQNIHDSLSVDRLSNLQRNIAGIRSTIHSLEGDLIATRNELSRAHQHLHLATMELADIQRAALEADIGLSKLVHQQQEGSAMSPLHFYEPPSLTRSFSRSNSRSSTSSDRLGYFTPNSSFVESGEDSDCYTPRSRASSHESFLSLTERDNTSYGSPTFDETTTYEKSHDKDTTPQTKNGKPKHKRRFKFDSGVKVSSALTYGMDPNNKESNSVDTPGTQGTSASTQEEFASMSESNGNAESDDEQRGRRVTFCRQQSFIRAHDLALGEESDNGSLFPLHDAHIGKVVNALFETGLELAMNESESWYAESSTGKILTKRAKKMANGELEGPIGQWPNAAHGDEVLVWSCKSPNNGHGSEYPVVKARGLIPTAASSMVDLLLDSTKVKQYNKMSLGRIDEHCFAEGVHRLTQCSVTGILGEAKIIRSKSQPPVIRKPVELRLLLHARRLPPDNEEGATYLTIGRSVWETEDGTADAEDTSATRCEMLLSVNLIRDLPITPSGAHWCEITTITHGVSPGIPISIGKRIGLAAAAKYVRDIRALFENNEV